MQRLHLPFTNLYVAGTQDPVRVADFPRHVKNLHANDDYLFTEDYSVSNIFAR